MPFRLPKTRRSRLSFTAACALAAGVALAGAWSGCSKNNTATPAATRPASEVEQHFAATMHPFLQNYCVGCHSGADAKAGLDLSYASAGQVARDMDRLQLIVSRLKGGDMPPRDAPKHPAAPDRAAAVAWMQSFSHAQALLHEGDPGVVLAHRLSNAEYNYVIRDLTGVDIQPTKEFPVDPANQAGFDNSGESLVMEPALLKKYMDAARNVSEHVVLKSDGIEFAPYPVSSVTDRDKFCVDRVLAFYQRMPTDLADYFLAAWRYQNRAALKTPDATLEDIATGAHLSPKYLKTVYDALHDSKDAVGPLAALQADWNALPVPDGSTLEAASKGARAMAQWIATIRPKVRPTFANLTINGMQAGSQPFVLWKDRQQESTRLAYAAGSALALKPGDFPSGNAGAALLKIPTDPAARQDYEAGFKHFCALFPDEFYITERARTYLDPAAEEKAHLTGRLLGAGLHSQTGYFRDDRPLYDMVLNLDQQKELDTLWQDFDLITDAPVREFQSMIWFERSDSRFMKTPEFNFVRAEDLGITSDPTFSKLRDTFLADARKVSTNPVALQALVDYFDGMNATFRAMEKGHAQSEPSHLAALQDFAARAYRRPLSPAEKDDLIAFYKTLRTEDGLSHEDAIRDSLVSILMSPYFCYRVTTNAPASAAVRAADSADSQPLTDRELASRLSFFLWSSIPDAELNQHAAAGDLHRPEVLRAQTQRMLKDARIAALATEFGGNWLDFRRFQEHNGVDRERFTSFDNTLREAMFQEPVRFLVDLMQNDRSVLDCLYGDYTFVDAPLAKLYGMPAPGGKGPAKPDAADAWWRVDNAHQYQRGGLLPMAVFLTKNAPGDRTSPVKRGYWVVRRVLGEEIAPPPPNVPVLPPDESKMGDLTLPQLLAQHRQDPSCATCHIHFDAVGLAFEGYNPIGQVRTADGGGKPIQNKVEFRDGSEGVGLDGLRAYLKSQRQDDYLDNLARKLLADALGRTLILSDDLLVEKMLASLKDNGYRFSSLAETIVTSPQFLNTRGQILASQKVVGP